MHLLLPAALAVCLCTAAPGEGPSATDIERRLDAIAVQTQSLRQQIDWLAMPAADNVVAPPAVEPPQTAEPPPAIDGGGVAPASTFTWSELQGQLKKQAWTKGDFRVVPYGFFHIAGIYESQPTTTGEYALWVDPPDVRRGGVAYIDAKTTRLGLDIAGPPPPLLNDATLGGRAEFDFQGAAVLRNEGGVLFRQGYIELKGDDYRFLVGQAWEVLSPLYPNMLLYVPAAGGGNLGYRRAQVRGERTFDLSETLLVTAQTSLNTSIVSDFARDPFISGNHAGWPVLEGRLATTLGRRVGTDAAPVAVGLSGHLGEQVFDFRGQDAEDDVQIATWSLCADLRLPITRRLGVQAELFHGSNLAAYMGGVLQGVDRGTRAGIRSTGGWIDVCYDWLPAVHNHWGYSIDDPVDGDLTEGRTYNQFLFSNLLFDATKNLLLGVELSLWKTLWIEHPAGETTRIEAVVRYTF